MPRTLPLVVAATGVAALATAGVLRFVVVPDRAQLPADTDTTRTYTGTLEAMLDAEALAAGDLANVLVRDLPVELTREVEVTDTVGGTADVLETSTVVAPDGTVLLETATTHLVDRRTMMEVGDRAGLVIGWPIDAPAEDTVGWSADLQSPVDLVFEGVEEHAGVETLRFTADVSGSIVDPAVLDRLPASVPTAVLPQLAAALDLPEALASRLPDLVAALPETVDLAYTIDSTSTYWVDQATGMVLDIERSESRRVALDAEGVPALPLADVFSLTYTGEADSVAATVADAQDAAAALDLYGRTLPAGLAVVGLGLLAGAVALGRRRSQDEVLDLTAAGAPERERDLSGV